MTLEARKLSGDASDFTFYGSLPEEVTVGEDDLYLLVGTILINPIIELHGNAPGKGGTVFGPGYEQATFMDIPGEKQIFSIDAHSVVQNAVRKISYEVTAS